MLRLQLLVVTTNVTSTLLKSVRASVYGAASSTVVAPTSSSVQYYARAVQSQIDRASLGSLPIVYRKKNTPELYL